MNKGFLASASGLMVIGALGLGAICMERIPTGSVGVQYSMSGGVKKEVLTEGFHIVSPTIKVKEFPVSTQQFFLSKDKREGSKDDDSFSVQTNDGSMNVDFEMSYAFDSESISKIAKKYGLKDGEEIVNTIVRGKVKTFISEVTADYSTMEAHLEKKGELNGKIQKHLSQKLEQYGIIVESANLSRTSVSPDVEKAIQSRQRTAQEVQNEKLALQKEEIKRQKAIIQGKRLQVEAENERKANETKSKALDDKILRQMTIEKWNGVLPQVTDGGNALINLK